MSILALHGFGTSAKPTTNRVGENEAMTSTNVIPSRPPNPAWFISQDLDRVMSQTNIEDSSQDANFTMDAANQWLFHQLQEERVARINLLNYTSQLERIIFDLIQDSQQNSVLHWDEINQMAQKVVRLQFRLAQANNQLIQANDVLAQANDQRAQANE